MAIRFRKSVKIAPGIRLNFNKNSTSVSLGTRGAHYTMSSTGRRTASVGIPGTGLYATEVVRSAAQVRERATPFSRGATPGATAAPPRPGVFSSKGEKALYALLLAEFSGDKKLAASEFVDRCKTIETQYPNVMYAVNLLAFLKILNEPEYDSKLIDAGSKLWSSRSSAFADPIVVKYFTAIKPVVRICEGASAVDIFNQQQFGFIFVEVLQEKDEFDRALQVLSEMEETELAKISRADVLLSKKAYAEILDLTNDIENVDDETALLLVFRGVAFREKGHFDASLECIKQGLSKASRQKGVLMRAHLERAATHQLMGHNALARKDLERVLVDEPENEEALKRLDSLGS